uniref:Uncharacterized protein n=1 Tax=Siphoviridae sp. ctFn287 TaxID=2826215 RepID=A0A8S5LVK5_9CAUD|nr:MAG TPA: hypothetical protein [Siphoviridae sp. ctFn287]
MPNKVVKIFNENGLKSKRNYTSPIVIEICLLKIGTLMRFTNS